jgi:tetratricopeptide (TPR) repeat protein
VPPRRLRGRLALAGGGLLLVLAVGGGLLRWRATRAAARPAPIVQEDPEETRLRRAVEATPNDATARLELGRYYEGHHRPFEAMWEYAEARQLVPANAELPIRLAAALQTGEAVDVAAPQLEETLRARPADLPLRQSLADLYLTMAEPQRARAVMEARRDAVWRDADAVVTLGRMLQASGEGAGAATAFQRSIALGKGGHEAWYRLGRLYLSQGQSAKARDALFHAMVALPSSPAYPFYAGMAYLQQGGPKDTQQAISFFKDTLALSPQYAPAHYQTGVALERMGQRHEAISQYSIAVMTDPGYPEPNQALGRCLTSEGNARDAHHYLGRYYDIKDRPADAVREFRAMETAAPTSTQPALLVGQVYVRTQQSEAAMAATEAALRRHPDDVQLMERLAILKINRGDRPAARRLLHRWLELKPNASRACWLLGRCEFGELKYAEGVAWLEKAIARQPNNPHYLAFLGAGMLRMGTPESRERAVQVLSQAVTLYPNDGDYQDLYGQALQRVGRYEEARRHFLQALNVNPSRVASYTPLSQLAWRLKRPGPAALLPSVTRSVQRRVTEENLLWRHVWEQPEDAAGRLKLARFFCRTGHLTRARDQLEQLLAQKPDWPDARQLATTVQRALEVQ